MTLKEVREVSRKGHGDEGHVVFPDGSAKSSEPSLVSKDSIGYGCANGG